MLNGLDLFSGIGGLSLALAPWVRPIAYCEIDRYCVGVLLSRFVDGRLSPAPIWDDIRTLSGKNFPEIDIIYGGFPCQDISLAGNGAGLEGERSGLVFEIFRLIDELAPPFVFLENVPATRTRGAERVCKELASRGYDCRWGVLSAYDVGAPHKRERWWLAAAHTDNINRNEFRNISQKNGKQERSQIERQDEAYKSCYAGWWKSEPDVGRVVNGLQFRVDRIRGLGNAVVPAQAREAFKRLMGLHF